MALDTVADYVAQARILLQDVIEPYRYSDGELVGALSMGVFEARRIRPDLFLKRFDSLPSFNPAAMGDEVKIDPQYRVAFLYYVVGHAQLRDEEDTQDARAVGFLNKFAAQLATGQP